jgi:hypothetical protein
MAEFADVATLEEFMTRPTRELEADLARVEGGILVLGVGGKMGPTLARMAKRAAPARRVIGVARFSDKGLKEKLQQSGIECIECDLLERAALEGLPRERNVVFMAGHKFGAAGDPSFTWAMNVAVPFMVAEHFRGSHIVAFSTACVYPFADVNGQGAPEDTPTLPPPGDYATSCVGREQMFRHASRRHGTPGRLVRLSYAIDLRYGVLYDVARSVFDQQPVALGMGYANVIWQGDANERTEARRALARRGVRQALLEEAVVLRRGGKECMARRHAGGGEAAGRAAGRDRDDDRLGGGLGRARAAKPRQADPFRDPGWKVLSIRSGHSTLPAAWRFRRPPPGIRARPTGG